MMDVLGPRKEAGFISLAVASNAHRELTACSEITASNISTVEEIMQICKAKGRAKVQC